MTGNKKKEKCDGGERLAKNIFKVMQCLGIGTMILFVLAAYFTAPWQGAIPGIVIGAMLVVYSRIWYSHHLENMKEIDEIFSTLDQVEQIIEQKTKEKEV